MRIHLPAIPHTRTAPEFSHCAFTAKVLKMIPMLQAQGIEVWHYGVGSENPGATCHVEIMDRELHEDLLGHNHQDPTRFYGDDADVLHPVYRVFNRRLMRALDKHVLPNEIVALPFGHGHEAGTRHHVGLNVETGIGYPVCLEPFRIYESEAWLHWHAAKEDRGVRHTEYVIPNYFNVDEWGLPYDENRRYVAFLGRIIPSKGMDIVWNLARAYPDIEFRLAGQGDASHWRLPNLHHVGHLRGLERRAFLQEAFCLLTPTQYIEPFGGVTVEANLCGAPALTTSAGAFTETVVPGFTGWNCRTLGDWCAALEWALALGQKDRQNIHDFAADTYGLAPIGRRYRAVLEQMIDQHRNQGWYARGTALPLPPAQRAKDITP